MLAIITSRFISAKRTGLKLLFCSLCVLAFQGCCWLTDCECNERFDYDVPAFIVQPIFVEPSFFPTYLNGVYFPNGVDVFYEGGNLFYSMIRPDAQGIPIKFYWSSNVPAPFDFGLDPPFNELQAGERIEFITLVSNRAFPDLDCFTMEAPVARAQLQTTIRTENGRLVEDEKFTELPSVPAGENRFVKHPIEYVGKGMYELRFIVGFNVDDLERDTTNNKISVLLDI